MKSVLITGGCGFVGSALARAFLSLSHYYVYSIDSLRKFVSTTSVPRHRRYVHINHDMRIEWDYPNIDGHEVDILFHCAGYAVPVSSLRNSVLLSDSDSVARYTDFKTISDLVDAEIELLEYALEIGAKLNAKKILFFSTCLMPDDKICNSVDRGVNKGKVLKEFAEVKFRIEEYIASKRQKSNVLIVRLPYLYGIFQSPLQFMPRLILGLMDKRSILNIKNACDGMYLGYVDDVAKSIVELCKDSDLSCNYLNIKTPVYSTKDIVDIVLFENIKQRMDNDVRDFELLEKECGAVRNGSEWEVNIQSNFAYRILQTIEFYRDNFQYYKEWLGYYEQILGE